MPKKVYMPLQRGHQKEEKSIGATIHIGRQFFLLLLYAGFLTYSSHTLAVTYLLFHEFY